MKLLIVAPSYVPATQFGGPVVATENLARAFGRYVAAEVVVATTMAGLDNYREMQPGEYKMDYGLVIRFAVSPLMERFGKSGFQYSRALFNWLRENISKFDAVVVVGVWNYPCIVGAKLARINNIPYIICPHGSLSSHELRKRGLLKTILLRVGVRENIAKANAVQFYSDVERLDSEANTRFSNGVVCQNVSLNYELDRELAREKVLKEFGFPRDSIVYIFLGRVISTKGVEELLQAFLLLARSVDSARLLIVGPISNEYREHLMGLVHRFDSRGLVILVEPRTGVEKWELLYGADVFVLPSYSEAFSLAMVEAMQAGLPIIISDKCNFSEAADLNLGFVVSNTPQDIANAMCVLASDASKRKLMRKNAKLFCDSNYSGSVVVRKLFSNSGIQL